MDNNPHGYRPRIQLWHGLGDTTILPPNQTQAILEWTNVLGLAANPNSTATVTFNGHSWTHESWQNACGYTVLDVWSEANGPHGTDANLNATYVIPFLGEDKSGATDPEIAQCGSTSAGGASGTGGATGTGGVSGTGGAPGTGGKAGGTGGASATGGTSGHGGSGGQAAVTVHVGP